MTDSKNTNFYPITKDYLDTFVEKVINSVLARESLTFIFKPYIGGARAWIKFILNNPNHTELYKKLSNHKVYYFEPTDCLDSSNTSFLYHLLEVVSENGIPGYDSLSLQEVVNNLRSELENQLKKQKVVIFLAKLDAFPNLNPTLGNLLYSIWKNHKRDLSFVTTISNESYKEQFSEVLGSFAEVLTQNIELINPLPKEDIVQSIQHWEGLLDHTFSDKEKDLIQKYANGSPYASKVLCQNIAKNTDKDPDEICKHVMQVNFPHIKGKQALSVNSETQDILLGDESISHNFSPQEKDILTLLIDKNGSTVNRDDVADALWGAKAYEKYSDWSIDQIVSKIRKKLLDLNFSGKIQTLRGQGFMLTN